MSPPPAPDPSDPDDRDPRRFRGWARPGPLIEAPALLGPDVTLDYLSGGFRIHQLRDGHRFSTDDLLAAWYGTLACPRAERVLELGSGIGSVGMIAAWRLPAARVVAIEAQARSCELQRESVRLNGLADRWELREGDFRDAGRFKDDAEKFDLVLGSPPYFPEGTGVPSGHPQKHACRFELRGDVGDYCRVAAPRLDWGGVFACVFPVRPAEQLERVRAGARAAGLACVRWRPVRLREDEEPLLGVFAFTRADHLPAGHAGFEEPPLVIRRRDGTVHPEYMAVKLSIGFPP